jgi:hypothetical protein
MNVNAGTTTCTASFLQTNALDMSRKIFIHIGMPKTGSSAIQAFLALNRETLNKGNYDYPNPPDFRLPFHITSGNAVQFETYIIDGNRKPLRTLLDESKYDNIILSAEALFHVLRRNPQNFSDYFKEYDYKIICYVRKIDDLVSSCINQSTKNHDLVDFDIKHMLDVHDYGICLTDALNYFDVNSIVIRPYEKSQFHGGDIFHDFLSIVGLSPNDELHYPDKAVNPSLSMDALLFRRAMNMTSFDREGPKEEHGLLSRVLNKVLTTRKNHDTKHRLNSYLAKYSISQDFGMPFQEQQLLSSAQRQYLIDQFKKKEESIARIFLGRRNGNLFLSPFEPADNSNTKLTAKKAEEIFRFIYREDPEMVLDMLRHINSTHHKYRSNEETVILIQALKNLFLDGFPEQFKNSGVFRDCFQLIFDLLYLHYSVDCGNYADYISGFSKNAEVKRSSYSNYIKLVSQDSDPQLRLTPVLGNKDSRTIVRLVVHAPSSTWAQCFYQTEKEPFYSENKSIRISLRKGSNKVYFVVDDSEFNGAIRIDPGNSPGRYLIEDIAIKTDKSYEDIFFEKTRRIDC